MSSVAQVYTISDLKDFDETCILVCQFFLFCLLPGGYRITQCQYLLELYALHFVFMPVIQKLDLFRAQHKLQTE